MAGQIIPKGKKKYLVRVFVGRDGTGKRKYVSKLVHGGKKAADDELAEMLTARSKGMLTVRAKDTVDEYLDAWLDTTAAPSVRMRTLADYTNVLKRYVRPHLGDARLANLSPVEVREMLVALRNRKLSPRTIRMAHEVLRNALEQAVADRLIPDNPARSRLVKKALPQKVKKEPATIPADAIVNFIDVAEGDRLGALWILLVMSGLRPSEALALRWADVNGNAVSVVRVLVDKPGKTGVPLHFAPPKSTSSRRAVVVPDVVVKALADHRKRQVADRLAADRWCEDLDHDDLIFTTETGEPVRQDHVRDQFKKVAKAAELPEGGVTVYALRHSCATLLLEKGIPLKVVSERLGHSTIALTADTYSHVTPSMQKQAADVLDDIAAG